MIEGRARLLFLVASVDPGAALALLVGVDLGRLLLLERLAGVALFLLFFGDPGARLHLVDGGADAHRAPLVRLVEILGRERAPAVRREDGAEGRAIRRDVGERREHIARELAHRRARAVDRVPHRERRRLAASLVAVGPERQQLDAHGERLLRALAPAADRLVGARGAREGRAQLLLGAVPERGDVSVDRAQHRRVLLHADDDRRRLVAVLPRDARQVHVPELLHPGVVGDDGHALDAERREHLRDVASERRVEDDDQHLVDLEALRVLVGEVREAVQADGRLAGARAALDDDEAGGRLRDQLELPRIDQRRDLGEELVRAPVAVAPDTELAGAVIVVGAIGRARAAAEPRARARALPLLAALEERALRRDDPAQRALDDREAAARQHVAVHLFAAEILLVVVALVVAIEEPADRRVAPVDDADAGAPVEVRRLADQHLALAVPLLEDHPAEVRRERVGGRGRDLRAAVRDLLQALHLLDQRRHILHARLGDLVAEREQVRVVVRAAVGRRDALRGEVLLHAEEDTLLVGWDGCELFVVRSVGRGGLRRTEIAQVWLHGGGRVSSL